MIEASFEKERDRSAAVSGAYQYDTGQRLRMHGLPSPQELAQEDGFLSGDIVTVQVHFGFQGDSQTEATLALWDEAERCYMAAIPDAYLQRNESVHAYVYVSYGMDDQGNWRTKTMYSLTMRPISRPAPNNVATQEQWDAWAMKTQEADMAADTAQAAEENADMAQTAALEAKKQAQEAAAKAYAATNDAEQAQMRMLDEQARWTGMTVRMVSLAAGETATAALSGGVLTLGAPQGSVGEKGEMGDSGPADIGLSMSDGILTITPK